MRNVTNYDDYVGHDELARLIDRASAKGKPPNPQKTRKKMRALFVLLAALALAAAVVPVDELIDNGDSYGEFRDLETVELDRMDVRGVSAVVSLRGAAGGAVAESKREEKKKEPRRAALALCCRELARGSRRCVMRRRAGFWPVLAFFFLFLIARQEWETRDDEEAVDVTKAKKTTAGTTTKKAGTTTKKAAAATTRPVRRVGGVNLRRRWGLREGRRRFSYTDAETRRRLRVLARERRRLGL